MTSSQYNYEAAKARWNKILGREYTLQEHAARGAFGGRPGFEAVDDFIALKVGGYGYSLADAIEATADLSDDDIEALYEKINTRKDQDARWARLMEEA